MDCVHVRCDVDVDVDIIGYGQEGGWIGGWCRAGASASGSTATALTRGTGRGTFDKGDGFDQVGCWSWWCGEILFEPWSNERVVVAVAVLCLFWTLVQITLGVTVTVTITTTSSTSTTSTTNRIVWKWFIFSLCHVGWKEIIHIILSILILICILIFIQWRPAADTTTSTDTYCSTWWRTISTSTGNGEGSGWHEETLVNQQTFYCSSHFFFLLDTCWL